MYCRNHPERLAIGICSKCGKPNCAECLIQVDGKDVCKNCLTSTQDAREIKLAPPPPPAEAYYKPVKHNSISGFLVFIFSMLPGAAHMYMGLMKRGLFFMTSLFLTIYLAGQFNSVLFGIIIPIIFCTSFFDAHSIKRRLRNGETVVDSVSEIVSFFSKNKGMIVLSFIVILILEAFSSLRYHNSFSSIAYRAYSCVPLLAIAAIIVLGIVCICRAKKK